MLANVNRDTERRREPFALEEVTRWLGHNFQPAPPAEAAPTAEELAERLQMLNSVYEGTGD